MNEPTPSDAQPVAWRYRYKRRSDDWDDWIVVTVDPNDWRNLPSQWTDFQCEPLYTAASLASARADGVREGLEQGWQSIDTAPRDGTKILAWWSGAPAITYWAKRTGFEGWQLPSMMTIRVPDESARAPMFWQPITIPAAIRVMINKDAGGV